MEVDSLDKNKYSCGQDRSTSPEILPSQLTQKANGNRGSRHFQDHHYFGSLEILTKNKKEKSPAIIANPKRPWPFALRLGLWVLSCLTFWGSLGVLTISILFLMVRDELPTLPALSHYNPPQTSRLLSQTDILLGEFAIERRDVMPASRIPRKLVEAFIASEDDNFFHHGGIDFMGIIRAAFANMKAGRIVQGGSTITQQVAKSLIGREKTFTRKFKEAIMAYRIEEKFTKDEILYLYMNQIYLGHGSYGVQAAARNYFHKNAWDLDLNQMAILAGLPQAPSLYDPVEQPQAALERRQYVLERMGDEGFATPEAVGAAKKAGVNAFPITDVFRKRAPYFVEEVRRQLQQKFGTEGVYEAGLLVETSVDLDWQHAAQASITTGLRQIDHRQGYNGPLINIQDQQERSRFLTALQKRFPEKLPYAQPVLAIVDEVQENLARISLGNTQGILPVMGMRWARKPNPTIHFNASAARVRDARRVLKAGDVILVQKANPKALMMGEPASLKSVITTEDLVVKLDQIPSVQGALVSVEPKLGYVRAIIGGYNFGDSEFNRILQACRQPGSAFKPLHYSLAIEEKGFHPATIVIDSAIVYDDPENQNRWKPQNFDMDFKGQVTVHKALINSMNVPAIKVLDAVGIKEAIAWAHKLGITSELREELGLALGASCVKPWDLTKVYSTFNQGGQRPELHFIRKVTDHFGRVLINHTAHTDPWQTWDEKFDRAYDHLARPRERLISQQSNYILVHLLQGVASRGTAASARKLGKPAAGKTGTTNDSADAWFMGFTHDVVTGVWVGNDEPKNPLGRGETGSRAALPIWISFMQEALSKRPQPDFDVPEGITFVRIDPNTGLRARPGSPSSVMEAFRHDDCPTEFGPSEDMAQPGQLFKEDGF
jgi:penicillin-binding protein 1A